MINELKQILLREFKRILHSKDLILICFIAPFVYFYGITYVYDFKSPKDIRVVVVDKDNSSISRNYTRMINSTPELNIVDYYPSTYSAYNEIFKNKADILFYIPEDFSKNIKNTKSSFSFIGANASNFLISSTAIKTIQQTAQYLSAKVLAKFLMNHEIPKEVATQMINPITCNYKWLFNSAKTYANFFVPFIIFTIFQQIIIVAVCHTMSLETQEKTWYQLFELSNGKILPIILGKAISYIAISLFCILLFVLLVMPFTSTVGHSKFILILISVFYSLLIVLFAMAISFLFRNTVVSLCALTFYSMPVMLISGFAWPLYMLPNYLEISAYVFPSTYFVNIFRYFSLDNISLSYMLLPALKIIIFASICFILDFILIKNKRLK